MASSGVITNQFKTGYKLRLNWSVTSQSTANNTSTMTVTAQLISDSSSYVINAGTVSKNISITVNGTTYSGTTTATIAGGATKDLFTKTGIVVPHSADGTKTVSMSCSFGIAVTLSGTYWGTISASGKGVLNTIARASTCTFSSMAMGTASTITITRADSSFTHTLEYYFGTKSGTIATKTTSTTPPFTPPLSLGSEIPDTTSGSGKIRLITFNSSGTEIGRKDYPLTLTIGDNYKPTITSIDTTVSNATIKSLFNLYVKGTTGVTTKINVSLTNAYGATVDSYQTKISGTTYNGQTITSSTLQKVGKVTITCTIKDSRGRPHELTKDIDVVDYINPVISITAQRNSTTETTINCTFNYTVTPLSNLNKWELKYRTRVANGTWSAYASITPTLYSGSSTFNVTNANKDSSYEIELFAKDSIAPSVIKTVTVQTTFVAMDLLNGGKGIAFGKVAETPNLLDVGLKAKFNDEVSVNRFINLTSTDEKNLRFLNCGTGLQTLYFFGGATTSSNALGLYDSTNARLVWLYGANGNFTISSPTSISAWANMNRSNTGFVEFGKVVMCWGRTDITPVANTPTGVDVAFPIVFSSVPRVVTSVVSSVVGTTVLGSGTADITTTGMKIYATRTNTTSTGVNWIAIGVIS